jgi:hypothetical protein
MTDSVVLLMSSWIKLSVLLTITNDLYWINFAEIQIILKFFFIILIWFWDLRLFIKILIKTKGDKLLYNYSIFELKVVLKSWNVENG